MIITIEFKGNGSLDMLNRMEKRARDLRPALALGAIYIKKQTSNTFERLKKGGKYRGVKWDSFSPNNRYRHSGARVTQSSNLMRDTGLTYRSIQSSLNARGFKIIADRPKSGAINRRDRRFLFFNSAEVNRLGRMTLNFIRTGRLKIAFT